MLLTIYTIGNLHTLTDVYQYLVMLIGENIITTTARIAVIWGLLFAILASVFRGRFHMWIYHFLVSYFIFEIFFMPVATVQIQDTITGQSTTVTNVPFGVAFIASMASTFSYEITGAIDNVFQLDGGPTVVWTPETGGYMANNAPGFLEAGYGGLFDYLKMGLEIDPKFAENDFGIVSEMDNYMQQCFFPYVASLPPSQVNSIIQSNNLISAIAVKSSFFMTYNGQTYTCDDFYNNVLTKDWNNFVNNVVQDPEVLGIEQDMITNIVSSMDALTGADLSFNQIISQDGIINMMKEDYFASGLTSDMNDRLLASYVVGRSEAQAKLYGEALFLWASKVVPTLQNFLEDFFVILFPFLIILIFLPLVSFGGVHAAIGYLKVVAWVYLITPVLAIINDIITVQAINQTTTWLQSVGLTGQNAGITLGNYGYLLSQGDLFPAIAGAAAISAPLWAWMLLQGFETGVMGMADLVGTIGAQFIGQEASVPVLTSNIVRDSREIQAGIMSGHTALESLSNVGTWMFEQNANLAGMYESIADYKVFSDMEHQLNVEGTLEATTMGIWGNTMLTDGYGYAVYNASDGRVNVAMNTGALSKDSLRLNRPYGQINIINDKNGNPVSAKLELTVGGGGLQLNLDRSLSGQESYMNSWAFQQSWGNNETFQKAKTATIGVLKAFGEKFLRGKGIEQLASITNSADVKQAFTDSQSLIHSLMNNYGWSEDKAVSFWAEYTTALNIAANSPGGLTEGKIAKIINHLMSIFDPKAGGGLGVKGTDTFNRNHSYNELMQYAESGDYKVVQSHALTYAVQNKAFFNEAKQMEGSELHNVSYQDLQQYREDWSKSENLMHSINQIYSEVKSSIGSVIESNPVAFLNWLYGGNLTKGQEIWAWDKIVTEISENNKEFEDKLVQAYAAYTIEMGNIKDVSQEVKSYLNEKKTEFKGMIEGEVKNGITSVHEHYKKGEVEVTNYEDKYKVNPSKEHIGSKAVGIFNTAYGGINNITANIQHNAETINPSAVGGQNLKHEVDSIVSDHPNTISGIANALKAYDNINPEFVRELEGATGLSILKGGVEAYFGWKAMKKLKEEASKLGKEIKSGDEKVENIAKEDGINFEEVADTGADVPIAETISGGLATGGAIGIAIGGGIAIGTLINDYWGKFIFNHVTKPLGNFISKETKLLPPLTTQEENEVGKKVPWKPQEQEK